MKYDKEGFPIYEPCCGCKHKDDNWNYCNKHKERIFYDMKYCKGYIKR